MGLLGANGAGKTTDVLHDVAGNSEDGRIHWWRGRYAAADVPACPLGWDNCQEPSTFRKLSVAENLLAVLETMGLRRREQLKTRRGAASGIGIEQRSNTRANL